MFEQLDGDGNRKVSLEEFKKAVPLLEKWGVQVNSPEETFRTIDTSGTGNILFDEFCIFAANQNLDLDDDDDFEVSEEDLLKLQNSDIKTN